MLELSQYFPPGKIQEERNISPKCLKQQRLLSNSPASLQPRLASLMVFSLYSIVDGLFVAKGVGEFAMAAVNLAVPFTNILFSIAVVFAVGAKHHHRHLPRPRRGRTGRQSPFPEPRLLTAIGVAISLLVLVFTVPFARLLGANETTLDYTGALSAPARAVRAVLHRLL